MNERFTATANNEIVNAKDPNRRLVAAFLLQAVQDTRLKDNDKNAGHIRMAENWFQSESDSPFTFVWICHILGRDIDSTRVKALGKFSEMRYEFFRNAQEKFQKCPGIFSEKELNFPSHVGIIILQCTMYCTQAVQAGLTDMELSRTQQAANMVRTLGITPYEAAKKMGLSPNGVYAALRNEKWIQQGQAAQVAPLNDIRPILHAARGVLAAWDDNHDDPESFIEALRITVNEYTEVGA